MSSLKKEDVYVGGGAQSAAYIRSKKEQPPSKGKSPPVPDEHIAANGGNFYIIPDYQSQLDIHNITLSWQLFEILLAMDEQQ